MPFRPAINSSIQIGTTTYTFTEHPSARGMPYGQTGRRATVYQVQDGSGNHHALKVFTRAFRSPRYEETANRLAQFSSLPGMQVCSRKVFTAQSHASLLQQYPDLEHSLIMPWVEGQTWQEIVLSRQPLTEERTRKVASALLTTLKEMEARQIAHCDLAGPNLLIDAVNGHADVALVDVEDLYAPGLVKPEKLPAGSVGYGHKTAAAGLWQLDADRFAGAVLLAEILGWCDERVRRIAAGEQFFNPSEIHQASDRFNILKDALEKRWGMATAEAFTAAWFSQTLAECPRLTDWASVLGQGPDPAKPTSSPASKPLVILDASEQVPLNDAGRYLYDSLKLQLAQKNFAEAEKLVNALKALALEFDTPARLLEETRRVASHEQAKQALEAQLAQLEAERKQLSAVIEAERDNLAKERVDLEKREDALRQCGTELQSLDAQIAALRGQPGLPGIEKPTRIMPTAPDNTSKKQPQRIPIGKRWLPITLVSVLSHSQGGLFTKESIPVEDVKFLPHTSSILTISDDSAGRIWSFDGEVIDEWVCSEDSPSCASVDKSQNLVAIGDSGGRVNLVDVQPEILDRAEFRLAYNINAIQFAPQGKIVAAGNSAGLHILDIGSGNIQKISYQWVCALAFSPDGFMLASSTEEGHIELFKAGKIIASAKVEDNPSLVFDLNSDYLFAADQSGQITVLIATDLSKVFSFSTISPSKLCSIAISPKNDLLATGTEEGEILLWSTGDGKLLETVTTHTDAVYGLDFHPDGRYLVSGSHDGRAILWEYE